MSDREPPSAAAMASTARTMKLGAVALLLCTLVLATQVTCCKHLLPCLASLAMSEWVVAGFSGCLGMWRFVGSCGVCIGGRRFVGLWVVNCLPVRVLGVGLLVAQVQWMVV